MPIKISINVTKIDKSQLYEGKNGKYLNLVLWETENDQYGNDYRVNQDISKEARDRGEKGAIIGNGKNFGNSAPKQQTTRKQQPPPQRKPPVDPDLDPAQDDIDF